MRLPLEVVEETRQALAAGDFRGVFEAFNQFIGLQSSRDAAGEAIYAALFDSAPSLQNMFMTPRPRGPPCTT